MTHQMAKTNKNKIRIGWHFGIGLNIHFMFAPMYGNWRIKSVAVVGFSGRRGVGKIMRNTFKKLLLIFQMRFFVCIYFY